MARRGEMLPAILVADRHGEIYAQYHTQAHRLPKVDEILQWLAFINSQCPECGVPEWPE